MTESPIVIAAKLYAFHGWHVLPVLGKVPQGGEGWQNKTTRNVDAVSSYFNYYGNHDGVGVLLGKKSGIVDIECDSDEAEDTLLELLNGEFPKTPTFQSTRGKHYLFKWRDGLPEKAVFKINGLEFRTGNGAAAQSVFPPSGDRWWVISPAEAAVAEFPAWERALLAIETISKKKPVAVGYMPAPSYGNDESLDVPKWLRKHGREILGSNTGSDGTTRWLIECPRIDWHTGPNAVRDCCVTQKQDGTLGGHCFHQTCGMADWDSLRIAIGELEYSDYHEIESEPIMDFSDFENEGLVVEAIHFQPTPEPKVELSQKPAPVECLELPGLVRDIANYTLSNSLYPQPELALAGALALMSVLTGRKVQDERRTRTNLYVMGLCKAAAGKEAARSVNKEIMAKSFGDAMLGPEAIGSSAGILTALAESPACLLQLDEIGKMFVAMKSPNATHLSKIGTELLKLYSSAAGIYTGDAYADKNKVKRINQPHLCVYGTSTPHIFWESLTAENVTEGLVGRFLVFDAPGYTKPRPYRAYDVPASLTDRVRWWIDFIPGGTRAGDLNSVNYRPITIPYAAGALERVDNHIDEIHEKRCDEDDLRAAIWSRSAEKAIKLSLLFCCSRSELREPGCITLEDVENGIRLSNMLTRRMVDRIGNHVSDNENEAKVKKVLRKITGKMTLSDFTRATQFLRDRRERNEILGMLCETGQVAMENAPSTGNKPTTYLWRNTIQNHFESR